VTDACVVLGYLDPKFFLGGSILLDADKARSVVVEHVAGPLGMSPQAAAAAILTVAPEHMINAIEDIAIAQGIDPRLASIVVGGGSGGFYASAILSRLKSPRAIVPQGASALSAIGALVSDLTSDFAEVLRISTAHFPIDEVNALLARLEARAESFLGTVSTEAIATEISFSVEAHYHQQIGHLEVPLPKGRFDGPEDVAFFRKTFDQVHEEVLAVSDERSEVETVTWRARALARLPQVDLERPWARSAADNIPDNSRPMFFPETGIVSGRVVRSGAIPLDTLIAGPAIIESPTTTIVVAPGTNAVRAASGSVLITPSSQELQ
jgi:N-methylhydantoinase A